jgi:hypothetical protein
MINHILNSRSVNKTTADFTSKICVAVQLCPYCRNVHYFADLQLLRQCYDPLVNPKNPSNLLTDMHHAVSVRRENRVIYH